MELILDQDPSFYKRALEIVAEDQDLRVIAVRLAKENPKLFCELVDVAPWRTEAYKLWVVQGKKVDAIKYVRSMTGMGLKESKEAVESLGDYQGDTNA